ncbi:MAG: hypothetical protein K0S31_4066 [Sphingobacterium multivorum]|nr:hypothetical protein [Sphingobacterium multivorum]
MKDQDLFIKELIDLFPSLEEELLDEDFRASITFQMGSFKRFIQEAIAKNDGDKFDAMVDFLTKNLPLRASFLLIKSKPFQKKEMRLRGWLLLSI